GWVGANVKPLLGGYTYASLTVGSDTTFYRKLIIYLPPGRRRHLLLLPECIEKPPVVSEKLTADPQGCQQTTLNLSPGFATNCVTVKSATKALLISPYIPKAKDEEKQGRRKSPTRKTGKVCVVESPGPNQGHKQLLNNNKLESSMRGKGAMESPGTKSGVKSSCQGCKQLLAIADQKAQQEGRERPQGEETRPKSPDLAVATGRLSGRSKDDRPLRPGSVMSTFEDADTEETVTCLQMTIYHPGQLQSGIFKSIRFCSKEKFPSIEVVKFGRNSNMCQYTFQDKQVSRVQFALQPFKQFNSSVLSFEIKNMSKKTSLMVDNQELGYLNKMDLPYKCMLRFGEYQFLLQKEDGESVESFETQFILSPRPLLQENNWPTQSPIPEDGVYSSYFTHRSSPAEMD
uniref:TRAF-interacting protein with FHA domain-containing protein A n=1 Tax=Rattus norvegicus TaxID=10116 RepID=A0A0G2K2Q4_RAT